jgi:hypothetical protein
MRARLLAALTGVALVGCGSAGPNEGSLAGSYAFHWETPAPAPFWLLDELRTSDGSVTVSAAPGQTIALLFAVPGYHVDLVPAGWTGTDWQMVVLVTGYRFSTFGTTQALVLHWTPGLGCHGQVNEDIDTKVFGSCTFTKTAP